MKRLDLGMIGGALLSFMVTVVMTGCDNDTKRPVEPGEPLVVTETVIMECDVPFSFKAIGSFGDTTVGVREGEGVAIQLVTEDGEAVSGETDMITYNTEWGVDVSYTVTTPCLVIDGNETEKPVVPIDGKCPTGFTVSDCNAAECVAIKCEDNETVVDGVCVVDLSCGDGTVLDEETNTCVLPTDDCGEGTVMNPETEMCVPVPELECVEGTVNIDEICLPLVYPNEDGDCSDSYVEGPRGRMCFLESELDGPTPR